MIWFSKEVHNNTGAESQRKHMQTKYHLRLTGVVTKYGEGVCATIQEGGGGASEVGGGGGAQQDLAMLKGVSKTCFEVVLTQEFEVLAILIGGAQNVSTL